MENIEPIKKEFVAGQMIRKFAESKLQESILMAINTLPKEKKGAVVLYGTVNNGEFELRQATLAKIGDSDRWSLVNTVSAKRDKQHIWDFKGEAGVVFQW